MEKNIEEYIKDLNSLLNQAKIDGNINLCMLIERILEQEPISIKICDFIIKSADNLEDSVYPLFNYVLDNKKEFGWFEFISLLSDERGSLIPYEGALKNAIDNNLNLDIMHEILRETNNQDEFCNHVNSKIGSQNNISPVLSVSEPSVEKQFIEHLKEENRLLTARIEALQSEVGAYRSEQKNMMESSIAEKRETLDYKVENENLRKENSKLKLAASIAEKKLKKNEEMVSQLTGINDQLTSKNSQFVVHMTKSADEIVELKNRLNNAEQECKLWKARCEDFEQQIIDLKAEIKVLTITPSKNVLSTGDSFSNAALFEVDNAVFDEQPSEITFEDIDQSQIIEIKNNRDDIKKHSNIFASLLSKHFEKKFEKKSQAEQDNLIFIKLMENEFSKEVVQLVKRIIRSNAQFSRVELYKMISNKASDNEVAIYCEALL